MQINYAPRFVSSIDCMDGRSGHAIRRFVDDRFGFRFIDRCTEPGMDHFSCHATEEQWDWIRHKVVDVSVAKHGSRVVILSGHDDCAGYPVCEDEHTKAILRGVERVSRWDFKVEEPVLLLGVWVSQASEEWWDWQARLLKRVVIDPAHERGIQATA